MTKKWDKHIQGTRVLSSLSYELQGHKRKLAVNAPTVSLSTPPWEKSSIELNRSEEDDQHQNNKKTKSFEGKPRKSV